MLTARNEPNARVWRSRRGPLRHPCQVIWSQWKLSHSHLSVGCGEEAAEQAVAAGGRRRSKKVRPSATARRPQVIATPLCAHRCGDATLLELTCRKGRIGAQGFVWFLRLNSIRKKTVAGLQR